VTVEYVRYLLPAVPVLCLLAAWVVVSVWEGRWRARYALAGLGAGSMVFTLFIGASLVRLQAPVAFGGQSRAQFLEHDLSGFPVIQFINTHLPADAKVVFYGHPFGFYCDRPYLWGDAQHSTLIPYDTFHNAEDLRASLQKIGVTHILINRRNLPPPDAPGYTQWVYALTDGAGPPLFEAHGVAVFALPGANPR